MFGEGSYRPPGEEGTRITKHDAVEASKSVSNTTPEKDLAHQSDDDVFMPEGSVANIKPADMEAASEIKGGAQVYKKIESAVEPEISDEEAYRQTLELETKNLELMRANPEGFSARERSLQEKVVDILQYYGKKTETTAQVRVQEPTVSIRNAVVEQNPDVMVAREAPAEVLRDQLAALEGSLESMLPNAKAELGALATTIDVNPEAINALPLTSPELWDMLKFNPTTEDVRKAVTSEKLKGNLIANKVLEAYQNGSGDKVAASAKILSMYMELKSQIKNVKTKLEQKNKAA